MGLKLLFTALIFIAIVGCKYSADGYREPDRIKQFHLTVNRDDYTIKTEMLSTEKQITVNDYKTYMWYSSRKILETRGGYGGKLIHGPYVSYYLNDQLREQGQVRFGLRDKTWKFWYPDGHLREIINYRNGIKEGPYKLYNDNGQIMASGTFKKDKLDGKFYTYGPTGKVIETKRYKMGEEKSRRKRKKSTNESSSLQTNKNLENYRQPEETTVGRKNERLRIFKRIDESTDKPKKIKKNGGSEKREKS